MATWAAKSAVQGITSSDSDASCLSSPSSPPLTPTPSTTISASPPASPPSTPSPTLDDCMDDSGFHDWMEMQLGVTGEMSVVERLQYLLDTGQFADVNIRVGQGNNVTLFKAHRLLLATASQPMYRLLQQATPGPGPSDMSTLRIIDMRPADFEKILKYIYTDQVDCANINVAFGLLRASRKWGLAGLGIKSLTYLEEFVDNFEPTTEDVKDNLFDLLVLSEDTLAELSAKCWQIILKHATSVIPCGGYLNLDKAMVQKVICHPDLKVEDQLKLFEAIRDWGLQYIKKHSLPLTALGTAVEELIKVVDFEKISDADFLGTVLTSECLGKAEVIAFFMTHGLEIPRKLDFNNNKQLPFWLTFCATSSSGKSIRGKNTKRHSSSSSSTSSPSSLAPVSEVLTSMCSLTQNGSVLEFNKVCRFKKGYRCLAKEIYQEHELRFRVDKNVKLLGVGFGFLFTPTDMGLNIHCQGPWETRQWTDIIQSYVRYSGDKTETADVRLMFLHPVRIEANQSYKVVVKMVRMNHGSNEVELWGGAGGVSCVETEDAEFYFIKAAVDPDKRVEEADGDTKPGVITELLYRLDTGEPDTPPPGPTRRRRPVQLEDEITSPTSLQTNPWRPRARPDSLRIPETPYARKRSPTSDDTKIPEAPSPIRRRERPPPEEYKPMSFSTNRWKIKPKEEKEEKPAHEEYKPSSFATNRWARPQPKVDSVSTTETRTERKRSVDEYKPSNSSINRWARPKEEQTETETQKESKKSAAEEYRPSSFSTNRWACPKEDTTDITKVETERNVSASEEYRPSSFSSNRWRTTPKEEVPTNTSRRASIEDNRWRTRPQEETKDTPFGMRRRLSNRTEDAPASHPFARRKESRNTNVDVPFFLRKTEDNKPATVSFGKNKWGGLSSSSTTTAISSSTTSSTSGTNSSSRPAGETPFQSRFLRSSGSASSSPYSSSSRFGSVRDSSLPRYTSTGGYVSRYDSTSDSPSSRTTTTASRFGGDGRAASPQASRKTLRYGTSATSSGSNLLALSSSSFGLGVGSSSVSSTSGSKALDRYSGSSTSSERYGTTGTPASTSSSRYGRASTPGRNGVAGSNISSSSSSSRYSGTSGLSSASGSRYGVSSTTPSGLPPYGARATSGTSSPSGRYVSRSATDTLSGTGRYGPSGTTRYGSGSRYSSPAPGSGSKYGSSVPGSGSRYSSPAPGSGSRQGSPAPTSDGKSGYCRGSTSGSSSRYASPVPAR